MATKGNVLLVEDEADLVFLLKYNLGVGGYRVVSATDARKGLAAARRSAPDLVLLDMMLPGMSGLEFLKVFREESRAPVLMLSARTDSPTRAMAMRQGADDYLVKPFSLTALFSRVESLLRRRGRSRRAAPAARTR